VEAVIIATPKGKVTLTLHGAIGRWECPSFGHQGVMLYRPPSSFRCDVPPRAFQHEDLHANASVTVLPSLLLRERYRPLSLQDTGLSRSRLTHLNSVRPIRHFKTSLLIHTHPSTRI